ncbi:MAG: hypothetical protein WCO89_00130 [Syntrophus sp. (in: bacteria)]
MSMIKMKNGVEIEEAQYETMTNLVRRYKKEPDDIYLEFGYLALMCVFDGLHIGIEKNGYAHS